MGDFVNPSNTGMLLPRSCYGHVSLVSEVFYFIIISEQLLCLISFLSCIFVHWFYTEREKLNVCLISSSRIKDLSMQTKEK